MTTAKNSNQISIRLPQLAATAIICLSLGANTRVDAANTFRDTKTSSIREIPKTYDASAEAPRNLQVLSLDVLSVPDAELYRSIFAAQKIGDWKAADKAIKKLDDQRLIGHVLADRYQRHPPSAGELRAWLVTYADLPEASDIYDLAESLSVTEGATAKPAFPDPWTGNSGYGTSLGFKSFLNDGGSPGAAHGFAAKIAKTLRHDDPAAAEALLADEIADRPMDAVELADIQGRIAAGYFYDGETSEARRLASLAAETQNPLGLWIGGLSAWKLGDMAAAGEAFGKLATQSGLSSWDRAAGEFWAYRSLKRAGQTAQANYWLKLAAMQPHSFYGFLAAQLLGSDAGWSWELPSLNAKNIALLLRLPAGGRALALVQVGQTTLAENELRRLNPQGHHHLQEAMLALAEASHMPSLALQLGGMATNDNGRFYDAALYPVPPWQPEHGFQVDRALLYALMRHESQFNPEAVSDRGACGLMQLMPATAHLIAGGNDADECSGRLLDPSYNMALGQKYVRRLAAEPLIGDNLLLLLAAYNGGPGKLARWMDGKTRGDPLLFMESLPVRETRDYVQQVLIQYWTYRARLAEPETSLAQLAHGEWPRYALRDESLPAPQGKRIKSVRADGFEMANNVLAVQSQ